MALRGLTMRVLGIGLAAGLASLLGACGVSEKDYNALKAENEDLRGRTATLEGQQRDKDSQIADLKQQLAAKPTGETWGNEPSGAPKGPKNRTSKGGSGDVVIEVAGDVLFASGQATLKAEAKKELDKVVKTLNTKYSGHNIRVDGYTDTDTPKKGKFKSNEALSEARANAVREYLVQKGISSNMITARGMGASSSKPTKKDNRRVDIVVLET